MYTLRVAGRAAHAGLEPEKGANALVALAEVVLAAAGLGRPELGTTVTPTMAAAGSASNVVPGRGDGRARRPHRRARGSRTGRRRRAAAGDQPWPAPGSASRAAPNRPPMPSSASAALFARAQACAARLGIGPLGGAAVGGRQRREFHGRRRHADPRRVGRGRRRRPRRRRARAGGDHARAGGAAGRAHRRPAGGRTGPGTPPEPVARPGARRPESRPARPEGPPGPSAGPVTGGAPERAPARRRRPPGRQASVTAPRSAPWARRAYLASTPERVPGGRNLPLRPAALDLGGVDVEVDGPGGHVDHDAVAVPDEGDRTAVDRFGRHVADAEAVGPAGEPPVGHERAVPAPRPAPFIAPVTASISRMPGRPWVPRSGSRRPSRAGSSRPGSPPSPRPRRRRPGPRPSNRSTSMPATFTTPPRVRASPRRTASPPSAWIGARQGWITCPSGAGRVERGQLLAHGAPGHGQAVAVEQAGVEQLSHHDRNAADPVEVDHVVAAVRLGVGDVRDPSAAPG